MIIKIEPTVYSWQPNNITIDEANFFKENGICEEEEKSDSKKDDKNPEGPPIERKWIHYKDMRFIGHIDQVPMSILNRFKADIEYFKPLQTMVERYGGSAVTLKESGATQTISIHLPSNELMAVKEVTWEEDFCTESLQRKLEAGWKIISAIPRPGQRRPDYVLGKN